ncbi:helix-turn-helix transcriptional regulator [Chitinophaga sp. SYP-B3965]|uniref:helix-turn-helix transcriptional regulator n=1 Tax=Chitinophaga sp. SYP-B3965 TaxID=2663120 RepID=UPI00352F29B6
MIGYIRLPEVLTLLPVSRMTWLNGCKSDLYPRPFKIGVRNIGWKISEIIACFNSFPRIDG